MRGRGRVNDWQPTRINRDEHEDHDDHEESSGRRSFASFVSFATIVIDSWIFQQTFIVFIVPS
jgi:hypothetical protein